MNAGEYIYEDFARNFAHVPGKASSVWAMREILGECVEAMYNGTIRQWLPSPGIAYPTAYIEQVMKDLDAEWDKEARRAPEYSGGPRFQDRLDHVQATALIERLRVAKGKPREYS
jgi:hypothetical protein